MWMHVFAHLGELLPAFRLTLSYGSGPQAWCDQTCTLKVWSPIADARPALRTGGHYIAEVAGFALGAQADFVRLAYLLVERQATV